jgi:hypothetical protein
MAPSSAGIQATLQKPFAFRPVPLLSGETGFNRDREGTKPQDNRAMQRFRDSFNKTRELDFHKSTLRGLPAH